MIKVLWIDDEHETLELIKESAQENDIELIGFKSAEDAIKELEKPERYAAVILDGIFYHTSKDTSTPSCDTPFGKVAKKLEGLKTKGIILPWFVLSGNTSFTKDKTSMVKVFMDKDYANAKVFDKKNKEETLLWTELKNSVQSTPIYKLKQEYSDVFRICKDIQIDTEAEKHLVNILTSIRNPNDKFEDELYFTQIRRILEYIFRDANRMGILHDKCIDTQGKVNLTESSLFLAGSATKHLNIKCQKRHFPKLIAKNVKDILFVTGAASHTTDPGINNTIGLQEYRSIIRTPYLLYSLTFQLMDVLLWYKEYKNQNSDILYNKSLWRDLT